ncbi:hypothetical protein ZWY2020_032435 [Hordeum vulgare]|nr:hypothetical protein ZWY2020_032435 [Hordeum vulgare]
MTREEVCGLRNKEKERKKAGRFGIFMEMQDKNLDIKAASEDSGMLFMRTSDLNLDAVKIVLDTVRVC